MSRTKRTTDSSDHGSHPQAKPNLRKRRARMPFSMKEHAEHDGITLLLRAAGVAKVTGAKRLNGNHAILPMANVNGVATCQ